MAKNLVITVSGKGGVGKTTFSTLLLQALLQYADLDILVVDADPDSNLPDLLGINVSRNETVGGCAFSLKKQIEKGTIPPTQTKKSILETEIFKNSLKETNEFDLLTMGRCEGDGCYCYPNSLLTEIIDTISTNYDITLMDMEAGLEHLSRRTARDVDIMFIVTDPSLMGIKTAKRIKEIIKEVNTSVKKMFLVGNKFTAETIGRLEEAAKEYEIELVGTIPQDAKIAEINFLGKPASELTKTEAYKAVIDIARKVGLINHN
ncbi:MAG: nucleotide-binding protein [Candidatus Helarchaeota archaeon]